MAKRHKYTKEQLANIEYNVAIKGLVQMFQLNPALNVDEVLNNLQIHVKEKLSQNAKTIKP